MFQSCSRRRDLSIATRRLGWARAISTTPHFQIIWRRSFGRGRGYDVVVAKKGHPEKEVADHGRSARHHSTACPGAIPGRPSLRGGPVSFSVLQQGLKASQHHVEQV